MNARSLAPAVAEAILGRFAGARNVLDLGGGHGEYALEFARRGLDVTMQDRPEVVAVAERRGWLASEGVRLFAGDFFETLPEPAFDLVLCAGVTHTYDEERNRRLFALLRPTVAPGGALVVVTFVRHRHPIVAIFAVQMVLAAPGADTHRQEDYRRWLLEAGFTSFDVVDIGNRPQSMLVAGAGCR